ncbi:hypothetical protein ASH01_14375 [Terrabacter sp. Soil811]|uniref:hypothetical protein n=1 Tax=Terrabacter sp. Soil811 TaxID=1736419 RepID=UPI0006F2D8AF|nr:hypothetical protein [Terrabacter sp. Soil811]KRF45105.1 hypothetical protein ASH01_14375 [Terrabacter sp. Soil811]
MRVEPAPSFTDPAGLYIVASRSSLHLFDLAAGAYLRLPGERSNTFPGDLAVLRLTQVERIAVGDSFFIWLDDPREYAVMDYWRQSSPISAIYLVKDACAEGATGPLSPAAQDRALAPGSDAHLVPHSRPGDSAHNSAHNSASPVWSGEVLPGLHVQLSGLWRVLTGPDDWSLEPASDEAGEGLAGRVLDWPLAQSEEWVTLLAVYASGAGERLQLRLDVAHRPDTDLRSTSGVCSMGLRVPPFPPRAPRPAPPGGA